MRERNEALDCRVYARAAASRIGLDRYQEKHWKELERLAGLVKREPKPLPADYVPPVPPQVAVARHAGVRGRIIVPPSW